MTRYFKICADNSNNLEIQNLRYIDIPKYFIWKKDNWYQRKRDSEKVISRLYFINPKDKKRFYLRMLLNLILGINSFDALKTINGIEYDLFKEAAY